MAQNIWDTGGGSSPFFNNSNYGADQSYWTAPIVSGNGSDSLVNQNPQAAYLRMISPFAGGNGAFANFARNQWPAINQGFLQAQMTNPDLRQIDYINNLGGADFFRRQYLLNDARTRGLSPINFGAGRHNWFPAI